jgi:hypothetical protein
MRVWQYYDDAATLGSYFEKDCAVRETTARTEPSRLGP